MGILQLDSPRIAIIVDNPYRDLPGLVLLSLKLCSDGATVLLVPNNIQHFELWRLVPDFVLHTNLHERRREMYERILYTGAGLGVLDTEGYLSTSPAEVAKILIEDRQLRDATGIYCCWGNRLADHLVGANVFGSHQVTVTGCPRMDFYHPKWQQAALQHSSHGAAYAENLVLLNSVFTYANPGYQTKENRVQWLMRDLKVSEDEARREQQRMRETLDEFVGLANRLARRFPRCMFIYRPHPFEDAELYHQLLEPLPNLKCVKEGTVDGWILRAKAIVARGCSTAFEAQMAGIPALAPSWIQLCWDTSHFDDASQMCDTEQQLTEALQQALTPVNPSTQSMETTISPAIAERFHAIDGCSYQRVASAVMSHLPVSARKQHERRCRELAYGKENAAVRLRRWWREQRAAIRDRFGLPPKQNSAFRQQQIRDEKIDRWDQSLKQYDSRTVNHIARSVLECDQAKIDGLCQEVAVADANEAGVYRFGREPGRTVVLARAA